MNKVIHNHSGFDEQTDLVGLIDRQGHSMIMAVGGWVAILLQHREANVHRPDPNQPLCGVALAGCRRAS